MAGDKHVHVRWQSSRAKIKSHVSLLLANWKSKVLGDFGNGSSHSVWGSILLKKLKGSSMPNTRCLAPNIGVHGPSQYVMNWGNCVFQSRQFCLG